MIIPLPDLPPSMARLDYAQDYPTLPPHLGHAPFSIRKGSEFPKCILQKGG